MFNIGLDTLRALSVFRNLAARHFSIESLGELGFNKVVVAIGAR